MRLTPTQRTAAKTTHSINFCRISALAFAAEPPARRIKVWRLVNNAPEVSSLTTSVCSLMSFRILHRSQTRGKGRVSMPLCAGIFSPHPACGVLAMLISQEGSKCEQRTLFDPP